LALGSTHPLT